MSNLETDENVQQAIEQLRQLIAESGSDSHFETRIVDDGGNTYMELINDKRLSWGSQGRLKKVSEVASRYINRNRLAIGLAIKGYETTLFHTALSRRIIQQRGYRDDVMQADKGFAGFQQLVTPVLMDDEKALLITQAANDLLARNDNLWDVLWSKPVPTQRLSEWIALWQPRIWSTNVLMWQEPAQTEAV